MVRVKGNLPLQIFFGMILGIFSGLFLGDLAAPLEKLGKAFIMLLKMPILPYMSLSLVHAIGSLSPKEAGSLLKRGGICLFALWTVCIFVVYIFASLFPSVSHPLHFSEASHSNMDREGILELFIPTNPIHAFANDMVPAVVLFSLLFGLALMKRREKDHILKGLKVTTLALEEITQWVMRLSPLGVFALMAATSGTLPFSELDQIRLFILVYILGAIFLSFFLIPLVVACCTPIGYGHFLKTLRPAVLLAFTTGNLLIALPQLIAALKSLLVPYREEAEEMQSEVESLVPLAYNFPTAGNLLTLSFLLFLSFFYAHPFRLGEHLTLIFLGIPSMFGSGAAIINGISFMIDQLHLPIDGLTLFLETLSLIRNFRSLLSVMGIAALTLIVSCSCHGRLYIRWTKLGWAFASSVLSLSLLFSIGFFLRGTPAVEEEVFSKLVIQHPVEFQELSREEAEDRLGTEDALDRIRRTGILRVGFHAENMPFCYRNHQGSLVGYDMAYAHRLAEVLDAKLVLIPFHYGELGEDLNRGRFDIAMSSISVTPERLREVQFSESYLEIDRVLVVKDYLREEFTHLSELKEEKSLKICAVKGTSFAKIAPTFFPLAKRCLIDNPNDFLELEEADALLWSKEEATTWSLIHPDFSVIIPQPNLGKEMYAYAVAPHSNQLLEFVDYWLDLMKLDGFQERQKRYWILGENPNDEPRWSIIRNVLHWVD